MNKPTRKEVERWIDQCEGGKLHYEDIGRYSIAWQKSLCKSYITLLDENEQLKKPYAEYERLRKRCERQAAVIEAAKWLDYNAEPPIQPGPSCPTTPWIVREKYILKLRQQLSALIKLENPS